MRERYRFLGRHCAANGRDVYMWESVLPLPGDSRYVQYSCYADWFWGSPARFSSTRRPNVGNRDAEIAAADARVAEIEAVITQTEAVLYDPEAKPARVAAAERYLAGARMALSQAQARRNALDG